MGGHDGGMTGLRERGSRRPAEDLGKLLLGAVTHHCAQEVAVFAERVRQTRPAERPQHRLSVQVLGPQQPQQRASETVIWVYLIRVRRIEKGREGVHQHRSRADGVAGECRLGGQAAFGSEPGSVLDDLQERCRQPLVGRGDFAGQPHRQAHSRLRGPALRNGSRRILQDLGQLPRDTGMVQVPARQVPPHVAELDLCRTLE